MPSNLWQDSDSENELPPGWSVSVEADGRVFYQNQRTGSCQSKHPISGRSKQVPPYLPQGWSQSVDVCGRTIYTNMITGRISYMDPRLAMASRLSANVNTATSHKTRFDKFTTADEVLLSTDLVGKYIIITASGCGMGRLLANLLVARRAIVICACARCPPGAKPLQSAQQTHVCQTTGGMFWIPCDLSKLVTVVQSAKFYTSLELPLDVCILAVDCFPRCTSNYSLTRIFVRLFKPRGIGLKLFHLITELQLMRPVFRTFQKLYTFCCPVVSCECHSDSHSAGLTEDGFERSLSRVIARIKRVTNSERVRIVVLSGDSHRNAPRNSADASELFGYVPSTLSARLDRYALSKLFQLGYLSELLQRLRDFNRRTPNAAQLPFVCACNTESILAYRCCGRWWQSLDDLLQDPVLFFLRLAHFLFTAFLQSPIQAAATPCLCVICDELPLLDTRPSRSCTTNPLLYLDACQPTKPDLDQFSCSRLWTFTEDALLAHFRKSSGWNPFFTQPSLSQLCQPDC
ncbi:hypothetical protein PHET_04039 [Paragonimus heterotremus]|uniref:WW domain-containing protein n=1 Tax=Paragonimus heterotremus TaxID=100268 RepID=A0A8J4T2I2_9TREM|nr:hypothetical protein PHET_04039 [Paragonimus heterotremus]